jgi:hypothetical protein
MARYSGLALSITTLRRSSARAAESDATCVIE